MAAKDILGRRGEDVAARYLTENGYRLIARNWRCPQGEIDVIVGKGDELVFVEVKTRTSTAYGHPFEAITLSKLARLRRLAGTWCETTDAGARHIRIDAIAVLAPRGQTPTIEHLQGVC